MGRVDRRETGRGGVGGGGSSLLAGPPLFFLIHLSSSNTARSRKLVSLEPDSIVLRREQRIKTSAMPNMSIGATD